MKYIKVQLIRKLANRLNGVDLTSYTVGQVVDLPERAAAILLAEGWALSIPPAASPDAAPATAAATPPLVIRVPTLVIWGEKDTALLAGNLNGLDQVVPKLTVKRIPEGTHWVVRVNQPAASTPQSEFMPV